jgi:hypothetical protein
MLVKYSCCCVTLQAGASLSMVPTPAFCVTVAATQAYAGPCVQTLLASCQYLLLTLAFFIACHACLLQLAAAGAERDNLAQQNAALASVLGKMLGAEPSSSSEAASVSADRAQGGVGPRTPAQSETGGAAAAAAAAGAAPTPAQMKEIGVLMRRLTKEKAGLIKARWDSSKLASLLL